MHGPPGTVCLPSTQSPDLLEPGKGTKHTAHLGLCPCRAAEKLSTLDLGMHETQGPVGTVLAWNTLGARAACTWKIHAALDCG